MNIKDPTPTSKTLIFITVCLSHSFTYELNRITKAKVTKEERMFGYYRFIGEELFDEAIHELVQQLAPRHGTNHPEEFDEIDDEHICIEVSASTCAKDTCSDCTDIAGNFEGSKICRPPVLSAPLDALWNHHQFLDTLNKAIEAGHTLFTGICHRLPDVENEPEIFSEQEEMEEGEL